MARLVVHVARSVPDLEIALDISGETFAEAFLQRRRFRGRTDGEAAGWIYGIAHRKIAHYFRRGAAEARALERLRLDAPRLEAEEQERLFELADLADVHARLRVQVGNLPDAQQAALRLRFEEDLSYEDVARNLDISPMAARARVARGLKTLSDSVVNPTHAQEAAG